MNKTIALVGNPNTGKSTLFNALTGANQHIGNWCGATVSAAKGYIKCGNNRAEVIDLPGIYGIEPLTRDEESTINYLKNNDVDLIVLVLDATGLERSLSLAVDFIERFDNLLVCVNLIDEANRKCIKIDFSKLETMLGTKVVSISASTGEGIAGLKKQLIEYNACNTVCTYTANEIYACTVINSCDIVNSTDRKIDRILTGRYTGIPIMAAVMLCIFWLTIKGTNYPSAFLHSMFVHAEKALYAITPDFLHGILLEGIFRTLGWIVSVMLPPMAIFFPLFTFLEDFGFLPRMAFNTDRIFKAVGVNGKNMLTMCMGFGCNAAGVVSARIIESPKERLIAILTNNFIPCNGRFAGLLVLSSLFIASSSLSTLFVLSVVIASSVLIYLAVTFVLSKTIKDGDDGSFIMELPPYRRPKLSKIMRRSIKEKILYVLGRAIAAALPAGAIIWILSNLNIHDVSLMDYIMSFFDPFAKLMGLDGCILTAFILGLPANEIVLPIIIMCYTGGNSLVDADNLAQLNHIFAENGWTLKTAVCTMVLFLNHFPCATTLLTIRKETNSILAASAAFLIPTAVGILLCILINFIF